MGDEKEVSMENLMTSLEGLGFSNLEVKIYLALLDYGAMSPYQLAKKIDISRSSIYNTLEHMVKKGMVEVLPEDTVMYLAQEPEVLMGKIVGDYEQNIHNAKKGLEHYLATRYEEKSAIINGYEIIIEKAKHIIKNAQDEIFINTDIELEVLKGDFEKAIEKGVRIIVFSFVEMDIECKGLEVYSHERKRTPDNTNSRFMIVADDAMVMIADACNDRNHWSGTVSNNKLMKKIVREHIHNDIYMLKLRDIYGRGIYEQIHINTSQEKKKF